MAPTTQGWFTNKAITEAMCSDPGVKGVTEGERGSLSPYAEGTTEDAQYARAEGTWEALGEVLSSQC